MAKASKKTPSEGQAEPIDPLKADFRNFLYVIWKHLGLPPPTPIQYAIAYYLQHGPKRKIIEAFRGVGKSWITVSYVLWRLYCNPSKERVLVVSAGAAMAEQFTTFCLQLLNDVPELQHLAPRDDQRSSTERFDVNGADPDPSPSVKSIGVFGQITGSRATIIIADDVETPKTAETESMRVKLRERVKEFDAVIKPGGTITYLGTPQVEHSLYTKLEEAGYEIRIWPAMFPGEEQRAFYAHRYAPELLARQANDNHLTGTPTEPSRFTQEDLSARGRSYGRSAFALQYMLDTRLSDATRQPLKLADLIVMDLPETDKGPMFVTHSTDPSNVISHLPNVGVSGDRYFKPAHVGDAWEPWSGSCMFIDPSGRGKDETAYAVIKHLAGKLFGTALGGLPGGYEDATLTQLARIAKAQKINLILVEENFGQGMFANLLKPVLIREGWPCTVELVRHSKQKELRIIETLEPIMNQHRLVIASHVIEEDYKSVEGYDDQSQAHLYRLFYQLPRITKDRGSLAHDDRLDALAAAVFYWEDKFKQDELGARNEADEQRMEESLRWFLSSAERPFGAGAMLGGDFDDDHGSFRRMGR